VERIAGEIRSSDSDCALDLGNKTLLVAARERLGAIARNADRYAIYSRRFESNFRLPSNG